MESQIPVQSEQDKNEAACTLTRTYMKVVLTHNF